MDLERLLMDIAVQRCSGMAVRASVEREATRVFGAQAA